LTVSPPPLGRTAARGALWFGAASAVAKASSLLLQIALGWLLTDGDFGHYGTVVGLLVLTSGLQDGGVNKYLRSQPTRFNDLVGAATLASIASCLVAMAILAALALLAPLLFHTPSIAPLIWVAMLGVALRPALALQRARLEVDLCFGRIATIDTTVLLFRAGATVGLAFAGFGAMSLIAALPLGNALEAILLAASGGLRGWSLSGAGIAGALGVLRRTRMIMLFVFAGNLSMRGDYLILSLVAPAVLGHYFFGFQLTAASLQLLTALGISVVPPLVARLVGHPERVAGALIRLVRINAWLVVPASTVAWLLLPAAMHLVWQGRWDAAIPVATAIALSMSIRGLVPTCDVLLEGLGAWRVLAVCELAESMLRAALVATAAVLSGGDLVAIAWTAAAVRAITGGIRIAITARVASASLRRLIAVISPVFVGAALVTVPAWLLAEALPGGRAAPLPAIAAASAALVGWSVVVALRGREALAELAMLRRGGRE